MRIYRPSVVHELMTEIAEDDSQHFAVNNVLYARSATYQEALDFRLAMAGFLVRNAGDGQYEILHRSAASGPNQAEVSNGQMPCE
jgi:hypothetical protein